MPGPAKTPSQISKQRGNPGKRAINKAEPQLSVQAPDMPYGLDDDGQAEWMRLIDSALKTRVLTLVDRGVVEMAAQAYATFIQATRLIQLHGLTYTTENTNGGIAIKPRPEVAIASDSWRRYRAAICELGFTPAARSKVSAIDQIENDPAAEFLN